MSAPKEAENAPAKTAKKTAAKSTSPTTSGKLQHFEVRLVRSGAGRSDTQRRTLAGLGLKKVGSVVYLKDIPPVRGMLYKVVHLISVSPKEGAPPLSNRGRARAHRAAQVS